MPRVKTTSLNVKQKLTQWFNKVNTTDELVFNPAEIDYADLQLDCFNKGFIVQVQSDVGPLMKFLYVEHLT